MALRTLLGFAVALLIFLGGCAGPSSTRDKASVPDEPGASLWQVDARQPFAIDVEDHSCNVVMLTLHLPRQHFIDLLPEPFTPMDAVNAYERTVLGSDRPAATEDQDPSGVAVGGIASHDCAHHETSEGSGMGQGQSSAFVFIEPPAAGINLPEAMVSSFAFGLAYHGDWSEAMDRLQVPRFGDHVLAADPAPGLLGPSSGLKIRAGGQTVVDLQMDSTQQFATFAGLYRVWVPTPSGLLILDVTHPHGGTELFGSLDPTCSFLAGSLPNTIFGITECAGEEDAGPSGVHQPKHAHAHTTLRWYPDWNGETLPTPDDAGADSRGNCDEPLICPSL